MAKEKLLHNHGERSFNLGTIGTGKEEKPLVLRPGGHLKTNQADELVKKYPRELSLVAAGEVDTSEVDALKAEIAELKKAPKASKGDDADEGKKTPPPPPAPKASK